MGHQIIHFCTNLYIEELSSHRGHWTEAGKEMVKSKLINAIEAGMHSAESDWKILKSFLKITLNYMFWDFLEEYCTRPYWWFLI